MKKNTLLLIGAGVVVAAIVGFFVFQSTGSGPGGNPVSQLENALTGAGSMKCEYTDTENRNTITYVKDGKIRSDFTGADGAGGMIYKDNAMWTWDEATKQGYSMVLPEYTETDEEIDLGQNQFDEKEDIEAEIEAYKESCSKESVSDSMFEPPADITFQDMGDFMNAMPEIPHEL